MVFPKISDHLPSAGEMVLFDRVGKQAMMNQLWGSVLMSNTNVS